MKTNGELDQFCELRSSRTSNFGGNLPGGKKYMPIRKAIDIRLVLRPATAGEPETRELEEEKMQQKDFSINDAVSFGWETMKNNIGFFILVLLIFWAASGIVSALSSVSRYMPLVAAVTFGLIFGVASFVLSMFINIAQFKIGLGFCDQKPADFNDLYTGYPYFLDFLIGSILYALIVIGGLILLIIPGIYWAVRYQYFGYLIIDRGMKPVDAIKKSGELTRGVWWHLFLFWLASVGIVIIGALLCGVGLLFAIPIVMVAVPYVYRTLLAGTPSAQGLEQPQQPPQPQGPPAT